jgi:hypothetical protein
VAKVMTRGELLAMRESLYRAYVNARERANNAEAVFNMAQERGLESDDLARELIKARMLENTYSRSVIRIGNEAISRR